MIVNNSFMWPLVLLFALTIFIGASLARVFYKMNQIPKNSVKKFIRKQSDEKIVVCVGDSITQGTIGFNYVDTLSKELNQSGYLFLNAGINGDLAFNAIKRVDDVIRCNPDFVTILIGTNDANSTLSVINEKNYIISKGLPVSPDMEWYEENLILLVRKIKQNTTAKIALISIPVIGEEINSISVQRSKEYSDVVKKVANNENVSYLPLNENQVKYIEDNNHVPKTLYRCGWALMAQTIYMHYIYNMSWDSISKRKGLQLTIDTIHQNSIGSNMIAKLIKCFLEAAHSE